MKKTILFTLAVILSLNILNAQGRSPLLSKEKTEYYNKQLEEKIEIINKRKTDKKTPE